MKWQDWFTSQSSDIGTRSPGESMEMNMKSAPLRGKKNRCKWKGCRKAAEQLAADRDGTVAHYCAQHAHKVIAGSLEYAVNCPNCGCLFGAS
jgi:hypothetical protein